MFHDLTLTLHYENNVINL